MKKFLLLGALISSFAMADVIQEFRGTLGTGVAVGYERRHQMENKYLELGYGAQVGTSFWAGVWNSYASGTPFAPGGSVYGTAKYRFDVPGDLDLFVKGEAGAGMLFVSGTGVVPYPHIGVGLGLETDKYTFTFGGDITAAGLQVGYKF